MNFGVSRFSRLLPAACAALFVNSLADLVDLTIAGWLLGESALGAIEFMWPVIEMLFFLGVTIGGGTAILYSAALGAFDKALAAKRYSCGLILSLLVGVTFAALLWVFRESVFSGFGIGPDIMKLVRPYWNCYLLQVVLSPLNLFLATMVATDGGVRASAAAIAGEFVVNVVASWFLCQNLGTAGCALGTVCGTLAGMLFLLLHFCSPACSLRFVPHFSFCDAWAAFRADFPSSSSFLFTALVFAMMNKLLLWRFGDVALTVMAVVSVVVNFRQLLDGIANAVQPVVGLYFAEGNGPAVRKVMWAALRIAVVLGGALTAVFLVFPELPGRIVGVESADMVHLSSGTVRMVALSFVPLGIGSLMIPYYLFVSRARVAMALTLVFEAMVPSVACVVGLLAFGYDGFWLGYALAPLAALVLFFAVWKAKAGAAFDWLQLPAVGAGMIRNWSAVVSEKAACKIAADVHALLEACGASLKTIVRADMLIEDTLMTIKERNAGRRVLAEVTLDRRAGVKISFRDDGVVAKSFTDSGGGDWLRAQTLGSVIRSATGRNDAITCGFNRNEFTFDEGQKT